MKFSVVRGFQAARHSRSSFLTSVAPRKVTRALFVGPMLRCPPMFYVPEIHMLLLLNLRRSASQTSTGWKSFSGVGGALESYAAVVWAIGLAEGGPFESNRGKMRQIGVAVVVWTFAPKLTRLVQIKLGPAKK